MSKTTTPILLSPGERATLKMWARGRGVPPRKAVRAKIITMAAKGVLNQDIAKTLDVSRPTVQLWRERFLSLRMTGLERDAPRSGRKPKIPMAKVRAVVEATLHSTPHDTPRWSTRSMARAQGVSQATVQRIWQLYNCTPCLVKAVDLAASLGIGPEFLEQLEDVVGLYLNPPDRALVFCGDQKSKTFDQRRPSSAEKGDYRPAARGREGDEAATLFATLRVLDGKVTGHGTAPLRSLEFIGFLKRIDDETPSGLALHLVLERFGAYTHRRITSWLDRHPRFHLHVTPASRSWLSFAECWLCERLDKRVSHGTLSSIPALVNAMQDYLDDHSQKPRVFAWSAPGKQIRVYSLIRRKMEAALPEPALPLSSFREYVADCHFSVDRATLAGFLFKQQMTIDDLANCWVYDTLYRQYLEDKIKKKILTAGLPFDPGKARVTVAGGSTRYLKFRVGFNFAPVLRGTAPPLVKVRIYRGKEKTPARNTPAVPGPMPVHATLDLKSWLARNDNGADIYRIAMLMRDHGIVDTAKASSVRNGVNLLEKIREAINGIASDVNGYTGEAKNFIFQRDVASLSGRSRDLTAAAEKTVGTSKAVKFWDTENQQRINPIPVRFWWEKEAHEMTLDEFTHLMNATAQEELYDRYREETGKEPDSARDVYRRYPHEWSSVVLGQKKRYRALYDALPDEVKDIEEFDARKGHAYFIEQAHAQGAYGRALEDGKIRREDLSQILGGYPEIAREYPELTETGVSRGEQPVAPPVWVPASALARQLQLEISERACELFDEAYSERKVDAMCRLLHPSLRSMRKLFEARTEIKLPEDASAPHEAIKVWAEKGVRQLRQYFADTSQDPQCGPETPNRSHHTP